MEQQGNNNDDNNINQVNNNLDRALHWYTISNTTNVMVSCDDLAVIFDLLQTQLAVTNEQNLDNN